MGWNARHFFFKREIVFNREGQILFRQAFIPKTRTTFYRGFLPVPPKFPTINPTDREKGKVVKRSHLKHLKNQDD